MQIPIQGRVNNVINGIIICFWLLVIPVCSNSQTIKIYDTSGVFGQTQSPVLVKESFLKKQLLNAVEEGRLGLLATYQSKENRKIIPVQIQRTGRNKTNSQLVFMMPNISAGLHEYKLIETDSVLKVRMAASLDPESGQVIIKEDGKEVLQYNYQTVFKKDVIRSRSEKEIKPQIGPIGGVYLKTYLEEHPTAKRDSSYTTEVYAVPRSDYINPLYGLKGEMLTNDWPADGEFHHRGIFWAWPDVEFGTERGDLYALQRIFARPTGKIEVKSGPVFAQVVAENLWMWEDIKPIVREHVVIRVYQAAATNRIIDITIKLEALEDSITLATRLTNSYGGFCVRMQSSEQQKISYFTGKAAAGPLRAWSDLNGEFNGNKSISGLTILQNQRNPEYPGTWVEYPNLAWVQPTFPSPNTRYPLRKGEPFLLRYRLIIHSGGTPDEIISKKRWDAFNDTLTPLYSFETTNE